MLFSYSWLQSFFGKKLPQPAEICRLIVKHGFEVEKVEKTAKDAIFDINILSNRPDCISYVGMATEIGAILGVKPNFPKTKHLKVKNPVAVRSLVDVEVVSPEACPRYAAKVVMGVKIGPSPKWLQERLESAGLRGINNVVDATNYVMLEMGQPLHAFDLDKLENKGGKSKIKKIIVRFARKDEAIDALGDKKYQLDPEILLICDETGPLALAGIKGGKRAEISENTKNVIIEAANFNPRRIRQASRRLGLQTDASYRFEHSLDPALAAAAADRVAELIAQTAGGQIAIGTVDRYAQPVKPKKMILDIGRAESLLGMDIQSAKVKKILESLGMTVKKGVKANLEVTVPTRRADISIAEDLIEEIGRVSGYDRVVPEMPRATVAPAAINYNWLWKNRAKDALAACGYSETRNYSFISGADCDNFSFIPESLLEVKNPVNADLRYLRPSLLVNLLKNIAANPGKGVLRQFEIGKVFTLDKKMEPQMLAGINKGADFFEAKGQLEFLFKSLGVGAFETAPIGADDKEIGQKLLDPTRRAKVLGGKKTIGVIGYLSGGISAKIGIEPPVVFELAMDDLARQATQKIEYRPISIYPEAVRDISVDMPVKSLARDIIAAVRQADRARLVKEIKIPQAPYISAGKKNILFTFHLHSDKKTLDSAEIADWQERTIAAIESNPEWRVKK